MTAFRQTEKQFKQRLKPVSYDGLIDLDKQNKFVVEGYSCYQFDDIPGLTLIKRALEPKCQAEMVLKALRDYTRDNMTNLDLHYQIDDFFQMVLRDQLCYITQEDMSQKAGYEITPLSDAEPKLATQLLPRLRWASQGLQYNWYTKQYELNNEPVPIDDILQDKAKYFIQLLAPFTRVCIGYQGANLQQDDKPEVYAERRCARTGAVVVSNAEVNDGVYEDSWSQDRAVQWKAEAGIVNFYQYKDTLTAHVDRSEVNLEAPLISFSFGNDAVFLISNKGLDATPQALLLQSGDVMIMSAEARRAYHGIPKVVEGSCPEYLFKEDFGIWNSELEKCTAQDYIKKSRININLRQVFYPQ